MVFECSDTGCSANQRLLFATAVVKKRIGMYTSVFKSPRYPNILVIKVMFPLKWLRIL
jgi:hypothetical protein